MQFDPFGETARDVIERERPLRVPRNLHTLPGRQVLVDLATRFADLGFHRLDFGIEIEIVLVGMILQILKTTLQLEDWLFEIKRLGIHV